MTYQKGTRPWSWIFSPSPLLQAVPPVSSWDRGRSQTFHVSISSIVYSADPTAEIDLNWTMPGSSCPLLEPQPLVEPCEKILLILLILSSVIDAGCGFPEVHLHRSNNHGCRVSRRVSFEDSKRPNCWGLTSQNRQQQHTF